MKRHTNIDITSVTVINIAFIVIKMKSFILVGKFLM